MSRESFTRQVDATPRENDLLEVALGYQHILQRVTQAAAKRGADLGPADERVLMAVLGVMSLEANLGRWLRRAETQAAESHAPPADMRASLLR